MDGLDFIETILVYKLPHLTREEIKKMLALNDIELKQTRFFQEIAEEEKKKGLFEGHQQGLKEGLKEGLFEGHRKGLQKEAINLVTRLVRRKFKGGEELSRLELKLQELSVDELEEMAEVLLDCKEIIELYDWLKRQNKP